MALKKEKIGIIDMGKGFIVLGYGVPENIIKDQNYNFYLRTVFNKIFDLASDDNARIVFCGGKTNLAKPYQKSESAEMMKLFKILCQRPFLKKYVKSWKLIEEDKSISTLENLLYAKGLVKGKEVYIFCETTRSSRISRVASKIFKGCKIKVLPIDFDQSQNRYNINKAEERELIGLKADLAAISSRKLLKRHHDIYQQRLSELREAKVSGRDLGEVNHWFGQEIKKLK